MAFTSCFALRSILQLPGFLRHGSRVRRQVETAPGAIGYALGADILSLRMYTLSAWESDAHLREFVKAEPHASASRAFRDATREPSVFVHWTVRGADLPLTWSDALRRQRAATR